MSEKDKFDYLAFLKWLSLGFGISGIGIVIAILLYLISH